MLKVAERTEVEEQENCHDFTVTHRCFPHATFLVIAAYEQLFSVLLLKIFAKLIDNTDSYSYTSVVYDIPSNPT